MASSSEIAMNPLKPITVDEYFEGPETLHPMELVHGIVREPPAPRYGHQSIVTRATVLLDQHVRAHRLGTVCVSPIDVVLDREQALVLQPDVVFVAGARSHIITDRIWGAPDLIVEVLSRRTAARDKTVKLGWYLQYGVGECWFVDSVARTIEIVDGQRPNDIARSFHGSAVLQSRVLGPLTVAAAEFFE